RPGCVRQAKGVAVGVGARVGVAVGEGVAEGSTVGAEAVAVGSVTYGEEQPERTIVRQNTATNWKRVMNILK
ncbi:MAG TPA: hypothetical protein VF898_02015, partial [Chloroflexota bacterium]